MKHSLLALAAVFFSCAAMAVTPITGPSSVCAGAVIVLTDATSGGTWTSGTPGVATVGSLTGVVTGVTAGVTIITYSTPGGDATLSLTVNPTPGAITGPGTVCTGSTITLADTPSGGTWMSSTPAVASVGSGSGVVSGMTAGITTITYVLPSGCSATRTITVSVCSPSLIVTTTAVGEQELFSIFPNPASSSFHVMIQGMDPAGVTIEVLDLSGRVLLTAPASGVQTTVSTTELPTGVYLCRLYAGGEYVGARKLVLTN